LSHRRGEQERHLLGLKNRSYAIGGPCLALSAGALRALRPILPDCMRWPSARPHSDTQLGRCILALNHSLRLPGHTDKALRAVFRHFPGRPTARLDGSTTQPFSESTLPPELALGDLSPPPAAVHSVKAPALMHRAHAQFHYGAVALAPDPASPRLRAFPCAHNPSLAAAVTVCDARAALPVWRGLAPADATGPPPPVFDACSVMHPECAPPPPPPPPASGLVAAVYLLCLQPAECARGPLFASLTALGAPVEAVAGAGPAAGGGVRAFAAVLRRARAMLAAVDAKAAAAEADGSGSGRRAGRAVLVVEEEAALREDFAEELGRLLSQARCGGPLAVTHGDFEGAGLFDATAAEPAGGGAADPGWGAVAAALRGAGPPGVLLLGAAPAIPAVRDRYDADALAAAAAAEPTAKAANGDTQASPATPPQQQQCVNFLPGTGGVGTAALLSSLALPLALELLAPSLTGGAAGGKAAGADPAPEDLGHVFLDLALAGLPVRVAWPPLASLN
jgi:hypothetical protein